MQTRNSLWLMTSCFICLLGPALPALGAGSAFVTLSDHDPFLPQYNGTVHGNGYVFEPLSLRTPILEPGIAFLNGISGGSSGGANGNVAIEDPNQGQTSLELVAIAAQVTVGGVSESLTQSGDAGLVASHVNSGSALVTAYAYDSIPSQYSDAAAILSAAESALRGHPFDLLLASTVSATAFGTAGFWDFDFAGETGSGAPFTAFSFTDIGVIPEPRPPLIALLPAIALLARRRSQLRTNIGH